SSFRDGLTVLEYFISTHGARKGLADTALRTADSGYLTRRMIDVAQDVIVGLESCVAEGDPIPGIWIRRRPGEALLAGMEECLAGSWAAAPVADPETGEVIVEGDKEITDEAAARIVAAGIEEVLVRSALSCTAERGICQKCY